MCSSSRLTWPGPAIFLEDSLIRSNIVSLMRYAVHARFGQLPRVLSVISRPLLQDAILGASMLMLVLAR